MSWVGAGLDCRQQYTRWRVGRVFPSLIGTENADQPLDLRVVRFQSVVQIGPTEPQTAATAGFEIVGPVEQGNPSSMIGVLCVASDTKPDNDRP